MHALPPDVVRLLSFHGPVELGIPQGEDVLRTRAHVAPMEECVYVFLRVGHPAIDALLARGDAELMARAPDGAYALRITGRAHPGVTVARRPDRGALEPWLPEGASAADHVAAELLPLHLELQRREAGEPVRYFGPTPLGRGWPRPGAALWRAASTGVGGLGVATGFLTLFGFLGWAGAEFPLRPVALVGGTALSAAGALGLRLIGVAWAYGRWRRGQGPLREGQAVVDGLVAPGLALRAGGAGLLAWLLGALLALAWGKDLALVMLFGNLVPIWGPGMALHRLLPGREAER